MINNVLLNSCINLCAEESTGILKGKESTITVYIVKVI